MRKGTIVLLCAAILISLWLPVNGDNSRLPAIPTLPGKTITQPKLPITDSLPDSITDSLPDSEPEPELELLTFTAPTDLTLVKAEENLVSIQWKDTSNAESKYVVERKESDGDYIQLAVLGKDATYYDDTSVKPGITYYYRVKAGKDSLDPILKKIKTSYTEYSNELEVSTPSSPGIISSGTIIKDPSKGAILPGGITNSPIKFDPRDIKITLPDTSNPDAEEELETTEEPETTTEPDEAGTSGINPPEELEAEAVSESEIELSWEDTSDGESGFLLYRNYTGEWELAAALDADITSYTDENLLPDTTYYYVLFAYRDETASTESNIVEVTTPGSAEEPVEAAPQPPAAPEALTAQAQNPTEVILTWQDKSDNEEGFLIYRTSSGDWELAATLGPGSASYTDRTVQPNTKYYYVVYAYVGEIPSKESNMAEITTPNQAAAAAVDFTGASGWALEELKKAVEYGLYTERVMSSYTQNITREEFCELVVKLHEKLKGAETTPAPINTFMDTTNENILKAYGAGIVNGTGKNTFSPYNPITRQDICVMLYRAITSAVANVDTGIDGAAVFEDENLIGTWAIREVKFAVKNGIMKGSGLRIMPRDNTSREQALLLIKRTYEMFSGKI